MTKFRRRIRATPELKALVESVVNDDLRVKSAVSRLRKELAQWGRGSMFVHISIADAKIIIKALED